MKKQKAIPFSQGWLFDDPLERGDWGLCRISPQHDMLVILVDQGLQMTRSALMACITFTASLFWA